jgi:hypothetical protein
MVWGQSVGAVRRGPKAQKQGSSHWWERFAVVVSAFALFVSMIATGISVWQTFLLKEQVNAGDRNRTYEGILTATENLCDLVAKNAPTWTDAAGDQDTGLSVLVIEKETVKDDFFSDQYREQFFSAYRRVDTALLTARIWAVSPQIDRFDDVREWVQQVFTPFRFAYRNDLEYYRNEYVKYYAMANYACTNDGDVNTRNLLASWLATGEWHEASKLIAGWAADDHLAAVILTKDERATMSEEQIVARAKQEKEASPPED